MIRSLADHEQELLRLRYVADMSFAEIAALQGRKLDAVKKKLYRLLARLQAQMETGNE
jgi:RNA polymerase sigma-70 factor (ECF subfamily)